MTTRGEYQHLIDHVKRHWLGAVIVTTFGLAWIGLGFVGNFTTAADSGPVIWWLVSEPYGRSITFGIFIVAALTYWIIYPWSIQHAKKTKIAALCDRLVTVGTLGLTNASSYPEVAIQLGGMIRKMHSLGAYRSSPVIEERIGAAMEGKLFGQWVKDSAPQTPGLPFYPAPLAATQPDYLVFWKAREAACEFAEVPPECETKNEEVSRGTELIARHIRCLCGIPTESEVVVIEPLHSSTRNR